MNDQNSISSLKSKNSRKIIIDLTEEQRLEIKEAFEIFDNDKNGFIDQKELEVCFKALGFLINKEEIIQIMNEFDINKNGFLNFENFQKIIGNKMKLRNPEEEYKRSFNLFKKDNSNTIKIDDLRKIAKEMKIGLTEDDLYDMVHEFDLDGDEEINFEEFKKIINPNL